MKFNAKNIKPFVKGAHRVFDDEGAIAFDRFTEEQRSLYAEGSVGLARTYTLPGVRLDFETDATGFHFTSVHNRATKSIGKIRFWFDLVIDGRLADSRGLTRDADRANPENNDVEDLEIAFRLPEGKKRVSLYFPPLFSVALKDAELTGETFVSPVKNRRTFVFFGDSITEDCSVFHTSLSYVNITSRAFDAEVFNYAIGGERFRADKFGARYHKADAVFSMYGTNDIFGKDMYRFVTNLHGYFEALHRAYPRTPVFVILPIPRLNAAFDVNRLIPSMDFIRDEIRLAIEQGGYSNFRIIDGKTLVPPLPDYYYDRNTHPNDLGHMQFGMNLIQELQEVFKD